MKIFAVINNYLPQQNQQESIFGTPEDTTEWYELPDSSVLRSGNPLFVPEFAERFEVFPTIVYRICRLGKSIASRFSHRYIDAFTMGAAVVATDLLEVLRREGKPWTRATAFDRCCLLGNLQPINTFNNNETLTVRCGDDEMTYQTSCLAHDIGRLISDLSKDNTLKTGDLILAGLTSKGMLLRQNTNLSVSLSISGTNLLDINIK